jgi:hypothetical protein
MQAHQTDSLSEYFTLPPPPMLFHYTSMDVLERITDNGQIWASHAIFLNDESELEHARSFIRNQALERAKAVNISDLIIKELIPIIDTTRLPDDVFVASFSEADDSLPQWRGYCTVGTGVSIGFDSNALSNCALEVDPFSSTKGADADLVCNRVLLKCVYTKEEKLNLISESVNAVLDAVRGEHPRLSTQDASSFIGSVIALCAPVFKHESFKEEREWRLVVQCKERKAPKRHFRAARSTMIPFIKLDVASGHRDTYIRQVKLGPSPNEYLGASGIAKLLEQRDLSAATVDRSKLPYRSW